LATNILEFSRDLPLLEGLLSVVLKKGKDHVQHKD
jgi:hypothetical protein